MRCGGRARAPNTGSLTPIWKSRAPSTRRCSAPSRPTRSTTSAQISRLYDRLQTLDWNALREHFEALFASIPADWYRANPVLHYEGYWASVFYSHLASLGLELIPEDVTNQGRIDLTLKLPQAIVVMEFKRIDGEAPTGEALAQLKARGYAEKYRSRGRPVWLLGVEFSSARRNIVGWAVEAG
jgi:hypothetical protein